MADILYVKEYRLHLFIDLEVVRSLLLKSILNQTYIHQEN
ncbi:hypothetical protein QY96_03834 [Bacillus thermotolerans]|uniref:Uncharacterized protein n=1 Tax=Bacillus thermotolerans TaxID=1221996 RepID=A0A0F5HN01_BACTR|nr:hypothetical protein QY95_03839 [Bacillus thermotolerans]KKB34827.1 hypothetical protein QY96_03834 [Bacillus thermotolerans]